MRSKCVMLGVVAVAALAMPCAGQTVLFVNSQAALGGDGESWGTAFRHLQDALHTARLEESWPTQIWVAQGDYKPDVSEFAPVQGENPNATFLITAGIEVYGGFAGGEQNLEERDWEENITLLNGVLVPGPQALSVHSYHVVTIDPFVFLKEEEGFPGSPRLDGFWIGNGRANGSDPLNRRGGGVHVNNTNLSPGDHNSPVIANCGFINNAAFDGCGGAAYVGSGDVRFENCRFIENAAVSGSGGAACVEAWELESDQGPPTVLFEDCLLQGNFADSINGSPDGGALWVGSFTEVSITGCSFLSNHTVGSGGGIFSAGVLDVYTSEFEGNHALSAGGGIRSVGTMSINRSIFRENTADFGGAVAPAGSAVDIHNTLFHENGAFIGGALNGSDFSLVNCTLVDNWSKTDFGTVISGEGDVINSIIWGSPASAAIDGAVSINYSAVEGGYPGDGNISDDPQFVDVNSDNFRLSAGSPCIDAGINAAVATPLDLDGNPRIVDGNGDDNPVADMGAYEAAEMAAPPVPTWNIATGGGYLDPGNWVDGILPGFGDNVVFGQTASNQVFTVSIPGSAPSPGSILVTNQRPIFDLSQAEFFGATGAVHVGTLGEPAELTVHNGFLEVWDGVQVGGATGQGILTIGEEAEIGAISSSVVHQSGVLRGTGNFNVWEGEFVNRGTISPGMSAPGDPIGTLTVGGGGFQQESAGRLQIQLASTSNHDKLDVQAWAQLGGTLVVSLFDGFEPSVGDQFTILEAPFIDQSSPTFHSHYMPELPAGLVMTVQYVDDLGPPAGTSGGMSVVLNVGTLEDLIGFGDPDSFEAGNGLPAGLEIADLNGNGRSDIVVLLRSVNPAQPGSVVVLLNQGGGTSFATIQFTAGLDPSDLVVADLNGSGAFDIAAVNRESGNVMIWHNDGDAEFSVVPDVVNVGGLPVGIVAGDFRGIGVTDLAVITVDPDTLVEIQNDGQGNFTPLAPIPLPAPPVSIVAAVFDLGIGLTDVAVGDEAGNIMIFLSTGGGNVAGLAGAFSATPDQSISTGRRTTAMSVEDVDNSKDPDIIVTSTESTLSPIAGFTETGFISVFLNEGGGEFTDALSVEIDGVPSSPALWDINQNGAADLAVVVDDPDDGRVIRIFRNDLLLTGTLVFSLEQEKLGLDQEPVFVRHGDMNNSGVSDMVALNASGALGGAASEEPEASVAIWLNGAAEPPDSSGSCAGFCGGQGPTGCWCDSACPALSDCCDDYCDHCGDLDHDFCPLPGGEGCGLGFWKQQHHWGHWAGYSVNELFCDIFDCSTQAAQNTYGGKTLVQVLNMGARGLNGLGRQAVAALLNASSTVSYNLSVNQVIAKVNQAIASGDGMMINATMIELDGLNNQKCPIFGHAPADMNHDGMVNVFDMLILLSNWGAVGPGDFSETGIVNVFDLLYLLSNWGPVSTP